MFMPREEMCMEVRTTLSGLMALVLRILLQLVLVDRVSRLPVLDKICAKWMEDLEGRRTDISCVGRMSLYSGPRL